MPKEIKTQYAIGDLVYLASADDVEREVIKAIKIVGLKHRVSYGFKETVGFWDFFYRGDGYSWKHQTDIFATQEEAEKRQADLQAREEAKAEQDRLKEIAQDEERLERDKENLRRKKKGLPPLTDNDYDD